MRTKNKKAMELTFTTIVVAILALLVLTVVAYIFISQSRSTGGQIKGIAEDQVCMKKITNEKGEVCYEKVSGYCISSTAKDKCEGEIVTAYCGFGDVCCTTKEQFKKKICSNYVKKNCF